MMTNTGTCKYKAPEILGGFMSHYDEKIDLWSCGAVLYYIVCDGTHAFNYINQKGKSHSKEFLKNQCTTQL